MDLGLIGGLAQGLQSGIESYQKQKKTNQDEAMNRNKLALAAQEHGYQLDASGNIVPSKATQLKQTDELDSYDPTKAENDRTAARGFLDASHPGLGKTIVGDSLSRNDLKRMGLLDLGGKVVSGEYNIQGKKAGADTANARINSREQLAGNNTINKDPQFNQIQPRILGAQKILSLMDGAEKGDFKSNQAMLGQLNAEISRLETGSQSPGLTQGEKTEMLSSAAHFHNILDTLTGNVTGVNLHEKFEQARGMVRDLGNSYVEGGNKRLDFLKAGSLPSQQQIFDDKKNEFNKSYGNAFQKPGLIGGQTSDKVKVSNGKKSFFIPQSDIENARADGFEVVK